MNPAQGVRGSVELPKLEGESDGLVIVPITEIESGRNFSTISPENRRKLALMNGIGLGVLTGLPAAAFGGLTYYFYKLDHEGIDSGNDRAGFYAPRAFVVPAIITSIFTIFFFASMASCWYGLTQRRHS